MRTSIKLPKPSKRYFNISKTGKFPLKCRGKRYANETITGKPSLTA